MVNKIIKTHSVNNGYVKKTVTFSTEENSAINKTQASQYNHSPAFHGPGNPDMYSWWTDMKGWIKSAADDAGKWIDNAAKDVGAGFEDMGKDIGISYSSNSTDTSPGHYYYSESTLF